MNCESRPRDNWLIMHTASGRQSRKESKGGRLLFYTECSAEIGKKRSLQWVMLRKFLCKVIWEKLSEKGEEWDGHQSQTSASRNFCLIWKCKLRAEAHQARWGKTWERTFEFNLVDQSPNKPYTVYMGTLSLSTIGAKNETVCRKTFGNLEEEICSMFLGRFTSWWLHTITMFFWGPKLWPSFESWPKTQFVATGTLGICCGSP